jgi:hypothetical protein
MFFFFVIFVNFVFSRLDTDPVRTITAGARNCSLPAAFPR